MWIKINEDRVRKDIILHYGRVTEFHPEVRITYDVDGYVKTGTIFFESNESAAEFLERLDKLCLHEAI